MPVLRSLGRGAATLPRAHGPLTIHKDYAGHGQDDALGRTSCGLDRAWLPLMTESQQQDCTQSFSHFPSSSSTEFQARSKSALESQCEDAPVISAHQEVEAGGGSRIDSAVRQV